MVAKVLFSPGGFMSPPSYGWTARRGEGRNVAREREQHPRKGKPCMTTEGGENELTLIVETRRCDGKY